MGAVLVTASDAAKKLRELAGDKGLKRGITNGLRRGLTVGKTAGLKKLRSSGVGRALWLGRNSKRKGISGVPPLIITVGKVRQAGNEYRSSLQEKGMAALIEKGGRTKSHKIEAKRSKLLHFGSGIRWSMAKVIRHPGSIIPRNPHLEHAAGVAAAAIPGAIEVGIEATIRKLGF